MRFHPIYLISIKKRTISYQKESNFQTIIKNYKQITFSLIVKLNSVRYQSKKRRIIIYSFENKKRILRLTKPQVLMKMMKLPSNDGVCLLGEAKREETLLNSFGQYEQNHQQGSATNTPQRNIQKHTTNYTPKQWYQRLDTDEFLSKCDQFILEHSTNPSVNQLQKKPVNFIQPSIPTKLFIQCQQCKIHKKKQVQWEIDKERLERMVKQLGDKLESLMGKYQIKGNALLRVGQCFSDRNPKQQKLTLTSHVITISHHVSIPEEQTLNFSKSRALSQHSNSTFLSENSPRQLITTNQMFIQFLKSHNQKLQSTSQQNKYLKIENYTLMKTKNQVAEIKREMQRTKTQRDMFKRKLIVLNNMRQKQQQKIRLNERGQKNKLKQRKTDNKQTEEELLQLSLTFSQQGDQKSKEEKVKKAQRPKFIADKKYA